MPVHWIVERVVALWGGVAGWTLDGSDHVHEAARLQLNIARARVQLGWQPRWNLGQTLERVVDWHRGWLQGRDPRRLCHDQISDYSSPRAAKA